MLNRVYLATSLLPNISKTLLQTLLCSMVAAGTGIAIGTLALIHSETLAGHLMVSIVVITIAVPGVMLFFLPQLRLELLRLFSVFNARVRAVAR
jgi:ABC-type dipeptide/oligopeptide/nickel transport system permease component